MSQSVESVRVSSLWLTLISLRHVSPSQPGDDVDRQRFVGTCSRDTNRTVAVAVATMREGYILQHQITSDLRSDLITSDQSLRIDQDEYKPT